MAEQLTEREQQALEHLRRANELEVSLAEYARSFDLELKQLYSAKQSIAKKGLLPWQEASDKLADFVEVQVTPRPAPAPVELVCRICHPSGLLIECTSWPTSEWIAVLAGCARVSS